MGRVRPGSTRCRLETVSGAQAPSAIAGAKPVFGDQGGKSGEGSGGEGSGGGSQACKQDPTKANAEQQSGTIDPDEVAKKIIEILGGNCWSCKIYAAIASQAGDFISKSYKQLTNNGSESGTFAVFAATIFAIVLAWKVLVIFGTSAAAPDMLANAQAWSDMVRVDGARGDRHIAVVRVRGDDRLADADDAGFFRQAGTSCTTF